METCERVIDGCTLTVPNEPWMVLPRPHLDDYDGCCGAGEAGGWRERLVPEHILGLRVSIACYIHDWWWMMCVRTIGEFRQANEEAPATLQQYGDVDMQQAYLLEIGYQFVLHAGSPEEAVRGVEQLADAAGIDVPVDLSIANIGDFENQIDAAASHEADELVVFGLQDRHGIPEISYFVLFLADQHVLELHVVLRENQGVVQHEPDLDPVRVRLLHSHDRCLGFLRVDRVEF